MQTCVQFEVSITNISGVIDLSVAKKEQIWLQNNECSTYGPNYLCVCAQDIETNVHKCKISITRNY